MRYRKILCPIDFSEPSRQAMRMAMRLASESGAEVTLAHVYELPVYGLPELPVSADLVDTIIRSGEEALAEWTKEASAMGPARVTSVLLQGAAWDRIVALAREGDFELVVVGTHGRSGLKHALLGSVAERVVRHAHCPVLVVRGEADVASAARTRP